eukprot:GHVU01171880.1.p1 GENE.GHVU01171880.1~~GHVU01171880.1.p1  ORF type:complete len:506 (-),score=45.24 GHVU01171880.1:261-1778(-)
MALETTLLWLLHTVVLDYRLYLGLLGLYLGNFYTNWYRSSLPPGPIPLPIVGNLLQVGTNSALVAMSKLRARYGDIFTIYMGSRPSVILTGYHVIKEAFVKQGDKTCGKPRALGALVESKNAILGINLTDGEKWTIHRKFAMKVLADLGMGKTFLQDRIQEEAGYLVASLGKHEGQAMYPHHDLHLAVGNIMASLIFGHRFDYTDPAYAKAVTRAEDGVKLVGKLRLLMVFPWLAKLPWDFCKMKEIRQIIGGQKMWIDECIGTARKEVEAGIYRDSYIAAYLERQKLPDAEYFSDRQLSVIIVDMFGAGTETVVTTMMWGITLLVMNPEVQTKVQVEIDEIVGHNRLVNWTDRPHMSYMEALIIEIQRIGAASPQTMHRTLEEVKIGGYTIPANTTISGLLLGLGRQEDKWPNYRKFSPERHLDAEGKLNRPETLIPFSIGTRYCMGEALAKMELFIFLTTLLQNFTFSWSPDVTKPDTLEGVYLGTWQAPEYPVIFKLRAQAS